MPAIRAPSGLYVDRTSGPSGLGSSCVPTIVSPGRVDVGAVFERVAKRRHTAMALHTVVRVLGSGGVFGQGKPLLEGISLAGQHGRH